MTHETALEPRLHRTLSSTGRVLDNQPIKPREQFVTKTGRLTTPYPTAKSERAASLWLIENATIEAKARFDDWNEFRFSKETPMKNGLLPPATIDDMTSYLFA